MNSSKAPGPNGIKCKLFQKIWDVVGNSIFQFVVNCFYTGTFDPIVNKTIIALIPKIKNPSKVYNFRPISLCNPCEYIETCVGFFD